MAPGRGLTRQPQPSITGGNVKGEVGAESYKSPDGNHPQSFAATAEVTAHRKPACTNTNRSAAGLSLGQFRNRLIDLACQARRDLAILACQP